MSESRPGQTTRPILLNPMFECRACLHRAWGAFISDLAPRSTTYGHINRRIGYDNQRFAVRRWQSTTSTSISKRADDPTIEPKSTKVSRHNAGPGQRTGDVQARSSKRKALRGELIEQRRAMVVKNEKRKQVDDGLDQTALLQSEPQQGVLTPAEKRKMAHALKFLTDPLKFADHINDLLLKRQNVDAALRFVRFASKSMQCVVAWNHVIRWHLANKKPNAAIKLYNEMKKRDQWPDSYTYVCLIRGLTDYWEHSSMLSKALNIYHSMSAPNSRVEPRTIHTNMALKICARAGDMDALWGVASRLPDKGPKSADGITYSIILNAIRRQALEEMDPEDSNIAEVVQHFDKAVLLGCRVWADVTTKWRRGDLKMDDALVCAMGRLLLLSCRPKAWDAVFSLVQGTENVPRMSKPVEDMDFGQYLPAPASSEDKKPVDENEASVGPSIRHSEGDEGETQLDQFVSMVMADSRQGDAFDHANSNVILTSPTNNTLSLLLEVCRKLLNKRAGDSYWNFLVKDGEFGIKPDGDNFHSYLRLLRQQRSSAQALGIIMNEMKPDQMEHKTFRIAMSTCIRDQSNPFAFGYCKSVVKLMVRHLDEPHIGTLIAYVQFAKKSKDVLNVVKTTRHLDEILHATSTSLIPRSVEEVQSLTNERKGALRNLLQYLMDSLAWVEGEKGFFAYSDKQWQEMRKRIVRSSNLFGRAGLKVDAVEEEASPASPQRATAAVNARSIRRMLKDGPGLSSTEDDDFAELPFEIDSVVKEARI